MMARLYNALALVSVATLLAGTGLVGYLGTTGRLAAPRLAVIAAALRGEEVGLPGPHPESQPAAAGAHENGAEVPSGTDGTPVPPGDTVPDPRAAQRRDQRQRLELERAAADVQARQRLLDQALQALLDGQEQLTAQQGALAVERQKTTETGQDAGFEREVEYVAGLAPAQAKEHVLRLWKKQPADAVRLFMVLDVGRGKRILAQFKTAEELEIMSQLLEQLRLQEPPGQAEESGTTTGLAP